ncbi:MAG TPA: hypothetical protein VKU37_00800 [Verrucomicrobiae bacterium]|nr:hypothetical protein [Verrucomicrobiae bacterium]
MNTNQGAKDNAVRTAANACIASCQKLAAQIERTKENLLAELQETLDVPERLFRLALDEAEALAWQTGFPNLLFPALALEKVQAVAGWNARQQVIRHGKFVRALSH